MYLDTPKEVHPSFSPETLGIFGRIEAYFGRAFIAARIPGKKNDMALVDRFNQRLVAG